MTIKVLSISFISPTFLYVIYDQKKFHECVTLPSTLCCATELFPSITKIFSQVAVNFHQTSQLVGALIPRLGDVCGGVRCGGVGCVVAVLRVAARYNAHQPAHVEEALQPLTVRNNKQACL